MIRRSLGGDAGRINYSNATLKLLIAKAYEVKEYQITGPDWIDSDGYDVTATIPPNTPKDQVPLMLQGLLEDRFKLAVHREKKELPVYALVVGKNGPKLKTAENAGGMRMSLSPNGMRLTAHAPLTALAEALSNLMDRPVVDQTGIEGIYDIDIEWTPDEHSNPRMSGKMMAARVMGPAGGEGKIGPPDSSSDTMQAPPIFAAVQEKLGLKLDARKAPLDFVIVDHAERVPTEN